MELYRERRPLERPPALAARDLFGDAERRRRERTHAAGLVRSTLRVDGTDGVVVATVRARGAGLLAALAVLVASLAVPEPRLRLPALWLCAAVVLTPLVHLVPGVTPSETAGRVTDRRITAATAPAYVAAVGLLWLALRPVVGPVATVLCGSVLAVGLGSYAVATGCRTESVSPLWLAVAGLLPAVATVANLSVAAALTETAGRWTAVVGSAAFAAFSVGLVVAYCWLVSGAVRRATFGPLASAPLRACALGGYLLVVAGLCLAALDLASTVVGRAPPPLVAVLCLPMAAPVGGWLYHVIETAAVRYRTLRRAERPTVDGTRVYVVDSEATFVRAVPFPRGVAVSRSVVRRLSGEELAAVVAHESHHLRARDRTLLALATLASVPVGRNALVAFLDYPARERAADDHAADVAGPEALVGALRRLDGLGSGSARAPTPFAAPYALLYGAAPGAANHPPVDDRVAAVTR